MSTGPFKLPFGGCSFLPTMLLLLKSYCIPLLKLSLQSRLMSSLSLQPSPQSLLHRSHNLSGLRARRLTCIDQAYEPSSLVHHLPQYTNLPQLAFFLLFHTQSRAEVSSQIQFPTTVWREESKTKQNNKKKPYALTRLLDMTFFLISIHTDTGTHKPKTPSSDHTRSIWTFYWKWGASPSGSWFSSNSLSSGVSKLSLYGQKSLLVRTGSQIYMTDEPCISHRKDRAGSLPPGFKRFPLKLLTLSSEKIYSNYSFALKKKKVLPELQDQAEYSEDQTLSCFPN